MLFKLSVLDDIGIDMDGVKVIQKSDATKQSLEGFTMSSRTNNDLIGVITGSNVDGNTTLGGTKVDLVSEI